MIIGIIGIGLIGASCALRLKSEKIASQILAADSNNQNLKDALALGLIDKISDIDEISKKSDFIIIATPVKYISSLALEVLDKIDANKAIVVDMGSTKEIVANAIDKHKNRGRYVLSHPMWGTENSGPKSAESSAFIGKKVVICDKEKSDANALQIAESIYKKIGLKITYMHSKNHDVHTAYVSHISHLTSYALALTVLAKEKNEANILTLASAGFESTVRLAKSPPEMWSSIFLDNKQNVLDVLTENIMQLEKFKKAIEKEDEKALKTLMSEANKIRKILS